MGAERRRAYGFEVRFLKADVEEPEVLVELDLGWHDEVMVDEWTRRVSI